MTDFPAFTAAEIHRLRAAWPIIAPHRVVELENIINQLERDRTAIVERNQQLQEVLERYANDNSKLRAANARLKNRIAKLIPKAKPRVTQRRRR